MLAKFVVALAAAPLAFAQTFTDCNPTKKTCPNDPGLNAASYSADFRQGASAAKSWTPTAGNIDYGSDGALFTIKKAGDSPTLQSNFAILFGTVEVTMKAAPGVGIVSSIVLESKDLDEIDWEFVGGDDGHAQTNFFGKGDTSVYDRGATYPVASSQSQFHTYKVDWSPERIIFSIDGNPLRTLAYTDPLTKGGSRYPQTPMNIKIGNWAGGDPSNAPGTIQWAGGKTDYSQAPFTMTVQSVKVTNTYPASEYKWKDMSGSWQSIEPIGGTTKAIASGVNVAVHAADGTASGSPTTVATTVSTSKTSTKTADAKATANVVSNAPVARYTTDSSSSSSSTLTTSGRGAATTGSATGMAGKNGTASSSSVPIQATGAAAGGPILTGLVAALTVAACLWAL